MGDQNTIRILAKYSGKCICGQRIGIGEPITYSKSSKRVIECPVCEKKRKQKAVIAVPSKVTMAQQQARFVEDYTLPDIHD